MAENIAKKIVIKHLEEQKNNLQFFDYMFENVSFLKEKSHVNDPDALSLMMEFVGPFKKKDVGTGDKFQTDLLTQHPEVKSLQKSLKTALGTATKATSSVKSVDLTSVEDVRSKVGNMMNAILNVAELEKEAMHNTGLEPEQLDAILSPDVKKSIETLYALGAYNLNAVKALIDQQVKALEKAVYPGVLKSAIANHKQNADAKDMERMQKSVQVPWSKHIPNLIKGLGDMGGPEAGSGIKVR